MSLELLVPLGLLGFLGIAVLILIYVIRPNYQAKHVTSTYIWKRSLGYKRRRPPVNKLRNILILICQLLILTAMALILAWPALVERADSDESDVVYILDSSASMYAQSEGVTRFDRALSDIRTRAEAVIADGGNVTVIVAEKEPRVVEPSRADSTRRLRFFEELDKLREKGASYGTADIEGALERCREEVLMKNPSASVYLFTDTEYGYVPKSVHCETVRDDEKEWNAAILDATAVREDGYYVITAQVACYGISSELKVTVNVEGANAIPASGVSGSSVEFYKYVDCADDAVKTVVFRVGGGIEDDNLFYYDISDTQRFFSYSSIQIGIEVDDAYSIDDNFFIYGGQKQLIKAVYYSTDPNPFIQTALGIARNALSDRYELEVTEIKRGDPPVTDGYDFYIFEHGMPSRLPNDGAVLLLDPGPESGIPAEAGIRVDKLSNLSGSVSLAEGEDADGHPIMKYIVPDAIEVSLYDVISDYDPAYQVLLTHDSNPLLLVRNEENVKVAVMAFSVHYSTIAKLPENFFFMYSLLDYFFPSIISGNAFDVGETFLLNTWGDTLTYSGTGDVFSSEEMPKPFSIDVPGSYSFNQQTYYGKNISVEVFIKPPAEESDIRKFADSFSDPYEGTETETAYRDLLLILASVLVGLLFVEWVLQSRENK